MSIPNLNLNLNAFQNWTKDLLPIKEMPNLIVATIFNIEI